MPRTISWMSSASVDRGRSNSTRASAAHYRRHRARHPISDSSVRAATRSAGREAFGEPVMHLRERGAALGRAARARGAAAPAPLPRAARATSPSAVRAYASASRRLASAPVEIAAQLQELAAHAVQLRNVAALAGAGGEGESFVDGRQPLVDALRLEQPVGEHGQEHRPGEVGLEPLLHGHAVAQQRETFVDAPEADERAALERAAPLRFLRQPVLAAERDVLLADRYCGRRLAAIGENAVQHEPGERACHRLTEPHRQGRASPSARASARSG